MPGSFQFFAEEGNHRPIEFAVKGHAVKTGRILAYLWYRSGERVAARCKKNKMVNASHHVLRRRTWKLLTHDRAIPWIRSLAVLFGAPQANRNGDRMEAAGSE